MADKLPTAGFVVAGSTVAGAAREVKKWNKEWSEETDKAFDAAPDIAKPFVATTAAVGHVGATAIGLTVGTLKGAANGLEKVGDYFSNLLK